MSERPVLDAKDSFARAISNVIKHGDTDVFPFPFENHIFFDFGDKVLELLLEIHKTDSDKDRAYAAFPPLHESLLASVGYTGFRWATQLDPIWNLYFLGLVIAIGSEIETSRVAIEDEHVFSYRYIDDVVDPDLFRRDIGWPQFMQASLRISEDHEFVIACDIADFYHHASHHRLENALLHLSFQSDIPSRIMRFLSHFSGNRSAGLPVGGPAARLLSELVLNQSDSILKAHGIRFCRFSDDYYIFAHTMEEAYSNLLFLSERLILNDGLSLQKSKIRIFTAAEFRNTAPFVPHRAKRQRNTRRFAPVQLWTHVRL